MRPCSTPGRVYRARVQGSSTPGYQQQEIEVIGFFNSKIEKSSFSMSYLVDVWFSMTKHC